MDDAQLKALERLLGLAERYGLSELRVEEGGVTVTIRSPSLPFEGSLSAPGYHAPGDGPEGAEPANSHTLLAPMTGTWYRAASPDLPSYVSEGDPVEIGQTVGLIEAMKVFSDVPADAAGSVAQFLVPNGQLVQQGEPILRIQTPE